MRLNTDEQTDEALMETVAAGDTSAFEILVNRYQEDVFRFCVHYMRDVEPARELTQETFVRVYIARNRFDPSRRFRPWMLCIARNLCFNELKRRKIAPMQSLEAYIEAKGHEPGNDQNEHPENLLVSHERSEYLAKILDELEPEQRELVTLRFLERMSAREIAAILETTEGAVRTRLHRILKHLREKYADMKEAFK